MKSKIFLALLFILSGCGGNPTVYNTHGRTIEQFAADKVACKYETNKVFASNADAATIMLGWGDMFRECLQNKGYTPQ